MICKDNGAGIYQKHALDWSQILGAIKHPVYVIDAHSHDIVAANRRLKVLQSEGRCKCYDVLHGFDVPCTEKGVACPMELVRASGKPAVVEHEHLGDDGGLETLEVEAFPVYDARGTLTHIVQITSDVTDQKKQQQTLQCNISSLEEQLQLAQRMESLGLLSGNIAHEFNNQLTVLEGYVELLSNGETDRKKKNYLETIDKVVTRAHALTRQLLVFSRAGDNQLKEVQLGNELDEFQFLLENLVGKAHQVAVRFDLDLHRVLADSSKINQVLINLAINARDALEEGNGSIMVSAKNVVLQRAVEMIGAVCPVGTYVMLQVADNGCGIPESLQRRIFEPFFTTKPKDKGTGLGLSVVYNIIRSHNGFLNLTSESGKGTQFDIYLPALLE